MSKPSEVTSKPAPSTFTSTRKSRWLNTAPVMAADLLMLIFSYWTAVLTRYVFSFPYELNVYVRLFPLLSLFLAVFFIQDLYPGFLMHPAEEIRRISRSILIVFLLLTSATFLTRDAELYSRSVVLMACALAIPCVAYGRIVARSSFTKMSWWGIPAVIVGSGPSAQRVTKKLLQNPDFGIRVIGYVSNEYPVSDMPCPRLGSYSLAPELAMTGKAEYAIIALAEKSGADVNRVVRDYCRSFQEVLFVPDTIGPYGSLGAVARDVGGELAIEVPQQLFRKTPQMIKRGMDVFGSAIGLLALSPLFLVFAILIKATSAGPVFFRHTRHGRFGELFSAWKFRTMIVNGDEVLEDYFRQYPEERLHWTREHKLRDDPRITVIGAFLRRSSLDELPQLWNVLIGKMSLVGPRPIVPNEVEEYAEYFDFCTMVRPGITGLWQVSGRNDLPFRQRISFNEYYVRNWSVWLDLYILARTFVVVWKGEGAY